MTFLEKLNSDLKEAMKAKDGVRMNCIRQVKTSVMNREVAKKKTLSDDEVMEVIASLAKAHVESIDSFTKGNRPDLVGKEEAELAILRAYMPEQLSDEELRIIVEAAVKQSGASAIKETGKVMGLIMPRVKGKADGGRINTLVREFLK